MGKPTDEKAELELNDVTARVDRIRVEGLCRTKDDIVIKSLKSLFNTRTFQDMLEKSIEARLMLEKLYCFKNIGIVIDTSSGPGSTPNIGYDITFNVVELKRITGRLNTTIENNQASLGVSFQAPNLAGRGECLQAEGKCGYRDTKTFNISFIKPLFYSNGISSTSLFKQYCENLSAGYKLAEHGLSFDLTFPYSETVKHSLVWEGIIRNIATLNRNIPFRIREESGYSLKSAFKNIFTIDTRDSNVLPSVGNLFQIKSELAGLGGDIGFVKNEILSQVSIPVFADISFQGSFATGIMNSINRSKHSVISDNFFIGGPLTLRGFHLNSVGPKIDGYSTGGSLYWLSAFHLYFPLPHRPKKNSFGDLFRVHFFSNLGNITDVGKDINESMDRLSKNFRFTYGFGLVCRLGQMARIELNYCFPVFYQSDDKLIDGVQLGLGVHFI